ncbi:unnamed protein product [Polarella glacialis]|uniref:Uncharacterized protein n=1 Tax=Polarella glacialis TaxID=89957 RepID=A0A813K3T6_POLGL|nr:unnamed protein product [Polarella glacialis]
MEPSCHRRLWSRITNKTWVVHHVNAEQIRCMWGIDVQAGYYKAGSQGELSLDVEWTPLELPDLCHCAPDPSFEDRDDLDEIKSETMRVLYDQAAEVSDKED